MKVLALMVGNEETASAQYRLLQYHDFLEENGVQIEYVHRNAINGDTVCAAADADVVFNQKCLFRNDLARRIISVANRVIFDFDDALWTRPGRPYSFPTQIRVNSRLRTWLRHADLVLCANRYLADYASSFSAKVRVLPMALDMVHWHPQAERQCTDKIRIGWVGSPGNLGSLESLNEALKELCGRYPSLEVMVYCGQKPRLSCPFVHVPFTLGTDARFVRSLDIGLLPLEDQDFHRGKSPIKAIQYLASGVAVVGNAYGATAEILHPGHGAAVSDDWVNKISGLIDDEQMRRRMTSAGLKFARQHHNTEFRQQELLQAIIGAR